MPKKEIKVEIVAETKNAEGKLATVSAALKSVADSATGASRQMRKINDSGMKKMASSADTVKKRVKSLGDELSKTASKADKMAKVVQALGSLASGSFAKDIVEGLLGAGAASIQAAAQMRQYEIAFQTMLKSTEQGTQMLRDLQKFAAETPFDVPGVVSAGQQLMAFGFKAQEVIPMLTSLGDAAAGLGQGTEGVSRLAYALGQMQTSGKLNAQDMMQLTSAGIAAWDMLANAAGVSIAEIKDMTSKGMVDSKEAVKVIVAGMNEEFGGMMEKTSTEVSGLLANIEETVGTTSAVIGQYMIDAFNIKGILKTASDSLGDFQTKLQNAANSGQSFRDVIKDCIPPEILVVAGSLAAVIGAVLVAAIGAAVAALVAFAGISATAIAVIAGIGAAVTWLIVYWNDLVDAIAQIPGAITACGAAAISLVTSILSGIVGLFGDMWADVTGDQENWLSSFADMLSRASQAVIEFANNAIAWFDAVFNAKSRAIAGPAPEGVGLSDEEKARRKSGQDIQQYIEETGMKPSEVPAYDPSKLITAPSGGGVSGGGGGSRLGAGGSFASAKNEELEAAQREDRIQEARLKVQNDRIREQMKNEEKLRQTQLQIAKKYGTDEQKLSISLAETEYTRKQELQRENMSFQEQLLAQENAIKEAKLKGVDQDELDLLEEKKQLLADNHELALKTINAQAEASAKYLNADYNNNRLKWQTSYNTAGSTVDQMTMDNEKYQQDATSAIYADESMTYDERLAALDEINQKYEDQKAKISTINSMQQYGNSLAKDFASGISDWITGTKTFGDVMRSVLQSLIQKLIQAAMYALIIASVTGGSFKVNFSKAFGNGFASGGSVSGPGTGTSDSIPAMLSDGEYVMNAKAVHRLGVPFLNGLNTGRLAGLAEGGIVTASAYQAPKGTTAQGNAAAGSTLNLNISTFDSSSFGDFLRNGGADTIKQMLFDNNRDFTAEAGVW